MFTVVIREIKAHGVAADPWAELAVPLGTKASVKNGRLTYSAAFEEAVRIPAACCVTLLEARGEESVPVLTAWYSGIPSVRSRTIDALPVPPGLATSCARPIGACRLAMPETPEEIEADFPGYGALPAEKWAQLNAAADDYVVQLKLQKMAPNDIHRDLGAGAYYVYGATRVVVHAARVAAQPKPAATDAARALEI